MCEKYQFTYSIVPIESIFDVEFDLKQPTAEERQKFDEEKQRDYETHTTLAESFEAVKNVHVDIAGIEEKRTRFKKMIECLPIESCFREDLIFYMKRMIIADFCLTHNFKKVLLGTNSHKVASDLLSSICKGRGASIANEISYVDDKNFGGRVSFMNPMRDFLEKEIALYNHNRNVKIIYQVPLAKLNQERANKGSSAPNF